MTRALRSALLLLATLALPAAAAAQADAEPSPPGTADVTAEGASDEAPRDAEPAGETSEVPVRAAAPEPATELPEGGLDRELELRTERREAPDYDGRPDPGPSAEEVLVWIPRVLFAPVTFVLDYVIRRPLGFFVETAERENWDGFLVDLFTWDERRSGLVPGFVLAWGLQPSVGLSFFSNDSIAPGHRLNAGVGFGGVDFLTADAAYEIRSMEGRVRVRLAGDVGRRPDRVHSGIGWSAQAERYRFREEWYRGALSLELRPWRESFVRLEAGVDGHAFDPDGYAAFSANGTGGSLADALADNRLGRPPGLDGYVAYRQSLRLAVDTREPEPAPGHGLHAEAFGELAFDLNEPNERRWVRYGGEVGAFVDLGHRRVVGLWGTARFVDPLARGRVPFTELTTAGQDSIVMSGFLNGQLRGRSLVATSLEYRYPIWSRLDGTLHASVGNVFGAHLEDFDVERLRFSAGFGVAMIQDPDETMLITVAVGTAPFVRGPGIDSVQLVFGTRRGL